MQSIKAATCRFFVALLVITLLPTAVWSQSVVRVPADAPTLDRAIAIVQDGGIIELAAGTYVPGGGGFRISRGRSLTIRPAAGAAVALDGQNDRPIVDIDENSLSTVIVLQDLALINGFSDGIAEAGGLTVDGATLVCNGCRFANNRSTSLVTGGGALLIRSEAQARLFDCLFEDNTALLRGGGIAVSRGALEVDRSRFLRNRVDVPGHAPNAAGGAIYVEDGSLRVERSRFVENAAGFSGGAILGIGVWRDPVATPATEIEIINSTFLRNRALNHPCCGTLGDQPTTGGAVNAEDQTLYTIVNSRFDENQAQQGGAIASYRGLGDVRDSVFRGNTTLPGAPQVGGAIQLVSNDFSDATTDFGAVNRRSVSLRVSGSIFQGRFGGTSAAANDGACIFVAGDRSRLLGLGVPAQGGLTNRADLRVTETLFYECDVNVVAGNAARGGALHAVLTDLEITDAMFLDSDAQGADARGGAIEASDRSRAVISGTTFARNTATVSGGALQIGGSELIVDGSRFYANEISPGESEPVSRSNGAALFSIPQLNNDSSPLSRDVTGVVRNSDFFGQVGLPVWEVDLTNGPINALRYDNNRFFNTSHGTNVFQNIANGFFGGLTVGELNQLVVQRANGTSTNKSQIPNVSLTSRPRVGQVLAAPTRVLEVGAAGDPSPPNPSFLGHAWLGASATLAGINLPSVSGIVPVDAAGTYALRVDGTTVATAEVTEDVDPDTCIPSATSLCLNDGRFEVRLDFRTPNNSGQARVVPEGTVDSGLFHFGNPDNWELLVKVLSNCDGPTNRFWVLAAATTNLEYTLQVTDTVGGVSKSYFNPLGTSAPAIVDTDAFDTCSASVTAGTPHLEAGLEAQPTISGPWPSSVPAYAQRSWHAPIEKGGCVPGTHVLCLNDGRFRVEVAFTAQNGLSGNGQVAPPGTVDSGLFFFFNPTNFEMLVKVLDNCSGPTNRFWVFAAATTNVAFTLRVTDTQSGAVMEYENPLGTQADAITDTNAFATCP